MTHNTFREKSIFRPNVRSIFVNMIKTIGIKSEDSQFFLNYRVDEGEIC